MIFHPENNTKSSVTIVQSKRNLLSQVFEWFAISRQNQAEAASLESQSLNDPAGEQAVWLSGFPTPKNRYDKDGFADR